jgi:hypothetical protein
MKEDWFGANVFQKLHSPCWSSGSIPRTCHAQKVFPYVRKPTQIIPMTRAGSLMVPRGSSEGPNESQLLQRPRKLSHCWELGWSTGKSYNEPFYKNLAFSLLSWCPPQMWCMCLLLSALWLKWQSLAHKPPDLFLVLLVDQKNWANFKTLRGDSDVSYWSSVYWSVLICQKDFY